MANLEVNRSELRPTLDLILDQLAVVLDHESSAILLLDNERIELVAARGYPAETHAAIAACPLADSVMLHRILSTDEPVMFGGHVDNDLFYNLACHGHGCSCLNVPLRVQDRPIGLLTINRHGRGAYTAVEGQMLAAFAEQAALTIENARLYDDARRRAMHLEAATEVARRLTLLQDLDELLAQTVRVIRETFGYDHVNILLIEPASGRLLLKQASGPNAELIKARGFSLQVGVDGITGWVAANGEPLLCNDVSREPRFMASDLVRDTRAELAVPLRLRGQPIGVLDVQSDQPGVFHRDDIAVLQLIGDQVAIAIENARLFAETKGRLEAMSVLHAVSIDIVAQLDLGQLLETLLRRAARLVQAKAAALYEYNAQTGVIGNIASFQTGSGWMASPLQVGAGQVGRVVQDGTPLVIYDYPAWPHALPQYATHPLVMRMAVPLRWQSQVIGVLMVLNHADAHRFDDNDMQVLSAFAELSAIALKNAELYAQVSSFGRTLEAQVAERTHELEQARRLALERAEQVQHLLSETVQVQEAERARIARDLHDSVTQLTIGAMLELQAAKADLSAARRDPAREKIDTARDLLKQIEREIRQAIFGLRPVQLDGSDLVAALHTYANSFQEMSGILCAVEARGEAVRLTPPVEAAVFRIVQEALHNVMTHARATTSGVTLDFQDAQLCVTVEDDGHGFDPSRVTSKSGHRVGLGSMRERAHGIGAQLHVLSRPGRGTRVQLVLGL